MVLQWNDSYSVGVTKFDNQHKQLFSLVQKLYTAMEDGKDDEILEEILNELVEYTHMHFSEEEAAMSAGGFPGLDMHRSEHDDLRGQVEQFVKDYKAGAIVMSGNVLGFLVDWLKQHIAKTDKKYGPHIKV